MPKLEPQTEFSVGIFSHERVKHLNLPFAAQVRSSLETHLEPCHQQLLFCSVASPPHPCSRRANLTIRTCLLAQGWRSTSTRSILITRSSCLVLQVRPRSDLDGLGAAVVCLSRWVVLARGEFSRDEFSTSDNDHGVFGQLYFMNVLAVQFSTGLWFARVRAASRCVLECV